MLLLNGERMNAEWFWGPPDALLHSKSGKSMNPGEDGVTALAYVHPLFYINLTHALAQVVSADQGIDLESIYLTHDNNFKAFPENVTRANLKVFPVDNLILDANYIYWWEWFYLVFRS